MEAGKKKVFSVQKFIENQRELGNSQTLIDLHMDSWAKDCEGLTEEEMRREQGCVTKNDWMVEVDE